MTMRDLEGVERREIWDGVMARMIEGDRMTLAIVEIAPGGRVPEHRHDNEQIGFVIEGSLTFTVGEETRTLGPGGSWCIRSGVPHHVDVGPKGAVVAEAYAPIRADWSAIPVLEPAPPRWPRETSDFP
jgi:quercetin dioxygenase-like cupin family protein